MLCFLPYKWTFLTVKGAQGTPASSHDSQNVSIAKLCFLVSLPLSKLLHCLNICSSQVLDTGNFTLHLPMKGCLQRTLPPKDAIKVQEAAARLSKMRFQNQGLKTGSFAATHGRTPIVASMLLIFPCVRLDCVSSASKTCLDYMLSVWAILPAQVSLPSLVEVVSLLHNWIRSPSRPLNEDHVDLVCVSVQIWARITFWCPDLGYILISVSGSIFGPRFGALDFVCNCRGPKQCPTMESETGTKIWPKSGPQNAIRGPKFVLRRKQGLHDLHSAVCWAIGFNCATN